jgi:hypothetical protein
LLEEPFHAAQCVDLLAAAMARVEMPCHRPGRPGIKCAIEVRADPSAREETDHHGCWTLLPGAGILMHP